MKTALALVLALALAPVAIANNNPCVDLPEGYDAENHPYLGGKIAQSEMDSRNLVVTVLDESCTGLNWDNKRSCFIADTFPRGTVMMKDKATEIVKYRWDCGNPVLELACGQSEEPGETCSNCASLTVPCTGCSGGAITINNIISSSGDNQDNSGSEQGSSTTPSSGRRAVWWPLWAIAGILFLGLAGIIIALLLRRRGRRRVVRNNDATTHPPATPARATTARPMRLVPPGGAEGDFVVHGRRPDALVFDDEGGVWTGFRGSQRTDEPPTQLAPEPPNDQTPPAPADPTTTS